MVLVVRRADSAVVIRAALVAKAAGAGNRPIAAALGRPVSTERGWLRRFTALAHGWRVSCTGLLHALDPLTGPIAVRACRVTDAVEVLGFAALDQSIAPRYAMNGMQPAETKTYLVQYLKLAGRSDTLFSDDATALIHQVSRGLPRAVNNLAVQSLVAAFATNKTIVDESSARAAVTEVTRD